MTLDSVTLPLLGLWVAIVAASITTYLHIARRDRRANRSDARHRQGDIGPAGRYAYRQAARRTLHRTAGNERPTPPTGIMPVLIPAPAVAADVEVADESYLPELVGPLVPGFGRRLSPGTLAQGIRLAVPTSTCPHCPSGGLVASGQCIICGRGEVVWMNGNHS